MGVRTGFLLSFAVFTGVVSTALGDELLGQDRVYSYRYHKQKDERGELRVHKIDARERVTNYLRHTEELLTVDSELCEYGGEKTALTPFSNPTGSFDVRRRDGRWWIVDPHGHPYFSLGMVSVKGKISPNPTLEDSGFNSLGAWSYLKSGKDTIEPSFRRSSRPMPYTHVVYLAAGFAKKLDLRTEEAGHPGFVADVIPVFNPGFEEFARREALRSLDRLRLMKDDGQPLGLEEDPFLIGIFSDNELPFSRQSLARYLDLLVDLHQHRYSGQREKALWIEHRGALQWLRDSRKPNRHEREKINACLYRTRAGKKLSDCLEVTAREADRFLRHLSGTYFRIAGQAVKAVLPKKLYLGSRLHGAALDEPVLMGASDAKELDIISVNLYGHWSFPTSLVEWARKAKKALLVSEFYANAEKFESSSTSQRNWAGAGWIVRNQTNRGRYYQNMVLSALRSEVVVGTHWFAFADSLNTNRGIVDVNEKPYLDLLDEMKRLNRNIYRLIRLELDKKAH